MKPILLTMCLCATSFNCGAADPAYCTTAGQVCRLANVRIIQSLDWVPTATSIAAHQEFRKALLAGDKEGLVQLLQAGGLLDTKSGDGLRVLDISVFNGRTEARMTTGKHAGKRVWVTAKWVVP